MTSGFVDYFETKTGMVIYFGLLAIVPVLLIINLIIHITTGPSFRERMIETYSQQTIHGIVDSVYNDKQNHNARMAILTNGTMYAIEDEWVIDVEKGDSISKNKGSFLFEVYRKPKKKMVLDYRKLIPPEQ